MSHELFWAAVVVGIVLSVAWVIAFLLSMSDAGWHWGKVRWWLTVPPALAWIWLPWLVYLLALLPWSAARCLFPPKADPAPTVPTFNPNGGLPTVEKP